jgi:NDP-sugar pyrophosphorylase family protein
MPLIEHTIATARQAVVTDFHVVTGHASERVEAFLSELSHRRRVSITPIRSAEWELGNGLSLLNLRHQRRVEMPPS